MGPVAIGQGATVLNWKSIDLDYIYKTIFLWWNSSIDCSEGGGCTIPGNIQGQIGQSSEQSGSVEDVPAQLMVWTTWHLKVYSSWNYCVILGIRQKWGRWKVNSHLKRKERVKAIRRPQRGNGRWNSRTTGFLILDNYRGVWLVKASLFTSASE